jgi:hypothetical protein
VDDLAKAMIGHRQFQSWSVRVPWAMFGFVPPALLAVAYLLSCFILWSGWRIFLPRTDSPFVQLQGLAIFYFGVGRFLYFGAPIFIGWAIGLVAARQRLHFIWPAVGLSLVALIGGMAQVQTSRPSLPDRGGQISMEFGLGSSAQDISITSVHALVILLLAALRYLANTKNEVCFGAGASSLAPHQSNQVQASAKRRCFHIV